MTDTPLTGRKVLLITVSAFSVIIGVNLTLAFKAVSTFPGLETKNSYVASQTFDADRTAQLALEWTVRARLEEGTLFLSIKDRAGRPVQPAVLDATLGRATHVGDDQTPEFVFDGNEYRAPADLAPGNWNLRMSAEAEDGTKFRQRIVLYVRADR